MSGQHDREAALKEIAKKRVVYGIAGMDDVPVRRDLTYRGSSGADLPMDIYYPHSPKSIPPVVVINFGYPDPEGRIRGFGPVTSWAQLMAASGIAAVIYGSEAPANDALALLSHLQAHAATLALDPTRIGVFATSGNAPIGLFVLMQQAGLACATLLYGYTMDADGVTAVADASAQYLFVDACAGTSVEDLPADVPLLFVRAGRDQFPGINEALDRVVARALARNLPLTLVNHSTGAHGFDLDEDTDLTREIVRQVLAFLRFHLKS